MQTDDKRPRGWSLSAAGRYTFFQCLQILKINKLGLFRGISYEYRVVKMACLGYGRIIQKRFLGKFSKLLDFR